MQWRKSMILGLLVALLTSVACLPRFSGEADSHAVAQTEPHALVLANVASTLNALNSLSFIAEYDEEADAAIRQQLQAKPRKIRVTMNRNGSFRVEAFRGTEEVVATVLYDGTEITEWSASENAWTRYPPGEPESPWFCRYLLVKDPPVLQHAQPWLGEYNALCDSIQRTFSKAKSVSADTQVVEGQKCDRLVIRQTQNQPPLTMKLQYEFYFDAKTHLPAMRIESMTASAFLFLSAGTQKRVTSYRDFRLDEPTSGESFSFEPPKGSRFIPPDDPRFWSSVPVGRPAPPLALPAMNGETVRIKDYIGKKVVLLSFWSTTCVPCLLEMPTLRRLHEEFQDEGLAVVGVNVGDKADQLASFLQRRPLPYMILHDPHYLSKRVYRLNGVPHTVLINKKGVVVHVWHGWNGEEEERRIRDELRALGIGEKGVRKNFLTPGKSS